MRGAGTFSGCHHRGSCVSCTLRSSLSGAGIGLLPWLLKSRFVLSNVAFSVASTTVVLFAFEEATKASATYKESKEAADPNDWTREVLPLLSTLFHLLLPSLIPA